MLPKTIHAKMVIKNQQNASMEAINNEIYV